MKYLFFAVFLCSSAIANAATGNLSVEVIVQCQCSHGTMVFLNSSTATVDSAIVDDNTHRATFTNIPVGTYTLYGRGSDRDDADGMLHGIVIESGKTRSVLLTLDMFRAHTGEPRFDYEDFLGTKKQAPMQYGTMHIIIVDEHGNPLPNTTILLRGRKKYKTNGPKASTVTFRNLQTGSYSIVAFNDSLYKIGFNEMACVFADRENTITIPMTSGTGDHTIFFRAASEEVEAIKQEQRSKNKK